MVSTAEVSKYLEGIDYPAERQQLIDKARSNNATAGVLNVLNKIPNTSYNSMEDLWFAVGKAEQ